MKTLSNGVCQINFVREKVENKKDQAKLKKWRVQLDASQFHEDYLDQYQLFLNASRHYFAGEIVKHSEDELAISYTLPEAAVSFSKYVKSLTPLARLELVQGAFWMFSEKSQVVPFINPENLFVLGTEIKVMHRGFETKIEPTIVSNDELLKQFRALIIFALDPKQDFSTIIAGSKGIQNAFVQKLEKADSVDAIIAEVQKQIKILAKKEQQNQVQINKKKFNLLRWSSLVAGVAVVALAVLSIVWGCFTLPKKQHIIDAQAAYMSEDYSKATQQLASYKTNRLPKNANYVLACSYINLDNLSNDQKTAVLKTISPSSDDNTLNYWIELGRGNYSNALSIAKNIGDNQYILHAYTKLYSKTKNDMQMNGAEKQKKLTSYRKSIDYYLQKLGGKANEFKGD